MIMEKVFYRYISSTSLLGADSTLAATFTAMSHGSLRNTLYTEQVTYMIIWLHCFYKEGALNVFLKEGSSLLQMRRLMWSWKCFILQMVDSTPLLKA